jgi:hypothetical protein
VAAVVALAACSGSAAHGRGDTAVDDDPLVVTASPSPSPSPSPDPLARGYVVGGRASAVFERVRGYVVTEPPRDLGGGHAVVQPQRGRGVA